MTKILVADPIAPEGIDLLKSKAEVDVRRGLKSEELIEILGDYDALIVRSETKVTGPVIAAGKRLQVIARAGVGVDNIDLEAATGGGIAVVNAPAGNTIAAAEHTLALIERYPELAVFPGAETLLLAGLRTGGAGCITASANVNVAAIRRLYDAWCGSGEDADALDRSVRAIRAAMESYPMVPALKCVAAHFRADPDWATVRPPMVALSSEQRADLLSKLEAAGFESSSLTS